MDTFHQVHGQQALAWVRSTADRRERGHAAAVVAAVGWCLALAWIAFVRGDAVPVLSLVDLGVHELGHLLTSPLPERITALMGSVSQVGAPLGLAVYFAWVRSDRIAASVCLTWAATAARDVSVYIRDAPRQELELLGGEHDWAFLLAANLEGAERLGRNVEAFGILLLLAAFGLAISVPFVRSRH